MLNNITRMNPDLVRILIIGAVALALYYVVSSHNVLENQGEVSVSTDIPEGYQQPQMPQYTPATDDPSAGQPQVDNALNALSNLSQFAKPDSYAYDFQPGKEPPRANQLNVVKQNTNVLPYPQVSNNYAPQQANLNGQFQIKTGTQPSLDCFPKDTVTPAELMPREDPYNTWSQVNPPTNGHLADRNFLESGHHFGIDTVSNSLRNANKQLRSDPVIPQIPVGPWMQSTYSPDTNRRQFEIGGDY
jgi:hypothetical protein